MNKCEKCGFLHYRTDPCRVAKKSTAALKEVQTGLASKDVRDNSTARVGGSLQGRHLNREDHIPQAGTQALPVDTNPSGTTRSRSSTGQSLGVAGSKPAVSEPEGQPKPRGRPRIHPDRKAYKAEHERNRRARMKLGTGN